MSQNRWIAFRERLRELVRENDYRGMAALYREFAHFLFEEGKDYYFLASHAAKMELAAIFSETADARVTVRAGDYEECGTCEACTGAGTFVMTVSEALKAMPIPFRECPLGLCRCSFQRYTGTAAPA